MVNCYVKVILNPDLESSYSIAVRTKGDCEIRQMNVKIVVCEAEQLVKIAKLIERQFVAKHSYDLRYNWRCTPKKFRENAKFREIMCRVFSTNALRMSGKIQIVQMQKTNRSAAENAKEVELSKYVELIKNHVEQHGAYPNFKLRNTEKRRRKIHNYLKSVCNKPRMSEDDAMFLARRVE
jgi:hypothetical protein